MSGAQFWAQVVATAVTGFFGIAYLIGAYAMAALTFGMASAPSKLERCLPVILVVVSAGCFWLAWWFSPWTVTVEF